MLGATGLAEQMHDEWLTKLLEDVGPQVGKKVRQALAAQRELRDLTRKPPEYQGHRDLTGPRPDDLPQTGSPDARQLVARDRSGRGSEFDAQGRAALARAVGQGNRARRRDGWVAGAETLPRLPGR